MRTPFYEMSKINYIKEEELGDFLDVIDVKNSYLPNVMNMLKLNPDNRDLKSYTRYGDVFVEQEKDEKERS